VEIKFGEILAKNRKKVGLTQGELARRIEAQTEEKIERTYMSRLESKKSNPNFSTIMHICKGLGMTLAEFFGGIEEKGRDKVVLIWKGTKLVKEKQLTKGEMTPIKVFRDLEVFSRQKDISKEFVPKYIYIEKKMFKHPKDIVGYEVKDEFKFKDFIFKKPILLINIVDKDPDFSPYCIVEIQDKKGNYKGVKIVFVEEFIEENIAFFDIYKSEMPDTNFPFIHAAYSKDEFEKDLIRGRVVGIISKMYD